MPIILVTSRYVGYMLLVEGLLSTGPTPSSLIHYDLQVLLLIVLFCYKAVIFINQPTGPIRSSSCDVRVLFVCPLFMY